MLNGYPVSNWSIINHTTSEAEFFCHGGRLLRVGLFGFCFRVCGRCQRTSVAVALQVWSAFFFFVVVGFFFFMCTFWISDTCLDRFWVNRRLFLSITTPCCGSYSRRGFVRFWEGCFGKAYHNRPGGEEAQRKPQFITHSHPKRSSPLYLFFSSRCGVIFGRASLAQLCLRVIFCFTSCRYG